MGSLSTWEVGCKSACVHGIITLGFWKRCIASLAGRISHGVVDRAMGF